VSADAGQVLVSIAQVAAGGSIVQGFLALARRRTELRQLDRQVDSVAVETADRLVSMQRAELETREKQIAELTQSREDLRRQLAVLAERVSSVQADLIVSQTEINRLRLELEYYQKHREGGG
jgi:septal ring factor EnvC (AmiA/AmiB activator)